MSAGSAESYEDPWAWLHAARTSALPDYTQFHVVAGVLPVRGEQQHQLVREALADLVIDVEIRDDLPGDAEGDWIWVVPDDTVPTKDSLTALLDRVRAEPDAAVIGSLLVEPRRRGAGTIISDWAQTITKSGRVRPLTDPGEFYQGQLDAVRALGVPAGGMLVRGDAWRFLGGLNEELPRDYWGLDFGWRANLAGYRAAFLAGDRALVARLLTVRKHAGLIVPGPVQSAMVAALADETHVHEQRARYHSRRDVLRPALVAAGFQVEGSEAGLYLWVTRGVDAWQTIADLAELGIVAGPGHFYGEHSPNHVRLALTASDADISEAAARLRASAVPRTV